MLRDILKELGLTTQEIDIFLQIAHTGAIPASIVAQKTHLKRTTCYQMVEEMVKKGFLKRTMVNNTRYYSAKTVEDLQHLIKKKLSGLEELGHTLTLHADELKNFYPKSASQTNICFYEGFEEIAKIYETLLREEDDTIYSLIQKQSSEHHALKKFWQWYRATRIKLKKKSVAIVNNAPEAKEYIERSSQHNRSTTNIDHTILPLYGDIKVSGNIVAIMSPYIGRIWGVSIENKEIADMFRGIVQILSLHGKSKK